MLHFGSNKTKLNLTIRQFIAKYKTTLYNEKYYTSQ
jgi:hypothetical protein